MSAQQESKKRPIHMMPAEFFNSDFDKETTYKYLKE